MLGTKIYKPISTDNSEKYTELASWCNKNNAMIVDQGDYYEAVPVPEPTVQELASMIRSQRDAKLSATDYLVVPDYPISPEDLEAVKVYRQALRDIPEQPGFPKNVQWPVEPQFLSAKKEKNEGSIGLAKVGL